MNWFQRHFQDGQKIHSRLTSVSSHVFFRTAFYWLQPHWIHFRESIALNRSFQWSHLWSNISEPDQLFHWKDPIHKPDSAVSNQSGRAKQRSVWLRIFSGRQDPHGHPPCEQWYIDRRKNTDCSIMATLLERLIFLQKVRIRGTSDIMSFQLIFTPNLVSYVVYCIASVSSS